MDKKGFQEYLRSRHLKEEEIAQHFSVVMKLEGFLRASGRRGALKSPGRDDFQAFSVRLIEEKQNSHENYLALARYGRFLKAREFFLAALELIDGSEAFDNLFKKVGEVAGEQKRDAIFEGIEIPGMGTPNAQKVVAMQAALERLEAALGPEACGTILGSGLRDLKDDYYQEEKKKYLECGNIDAYLKRKGDDFIAELEGIKRENGLYFNQEITDEVIAFVQEHPEIRQGVRVGDILYEAKIPYQAKEYLAEKDDARKRYYYCHCPWAKESMRTGRSAISPRFCNCSAAFHKKPYEVIFGKPLKAEVLESVLQGDIWCKFAIHLPEEAVAG